MRHIPARDRGSSAVEYGLLVAAIAAVIVGVVFVLGGFVRQAFEHTCDAITSGAQIDPGSCSQQPPPGAVSG